MIIQILIILSEKKFSAYLLPSLYRGTGSSTIFCFYILVEILELLLDM